MKRFILFCFLFGSRLMFAQNNVSVTYSNPNDLVSSKYQPSVFDLGNKSAQLGLNYSLWLGNNAFDYKTANTIYQSGKVDNADVNQLLNKLKNRNIFGAGHDAQLLGLAFQLKLKNESKLTFGLSVNDKSGVSLVFPEDLLRLVVKGNKQFAGQTIQLGPSALNFNYRREYALSSAFDLLSTDRVKLRLGVRAKYLQGIAALYMKQSNASLYTQPEGKYIDMSFDYRIQTAGMDNFSPFQSSGKGLGLDLGTTLQLGKHWEFSSSVLDLGSIRYTTNTESYSKTASVRYEGLVVNQLFGNNVFQGDSLANVFVPDKAKGNAFRMPLDTKLRLDAVYKTQKKDTKRDRVYTNNAIYLTYIQGFNNLPGATTRPYISMGYNHEFVKLFGGGGMVAVGGYNKFTMGAFFAIKMGQKVRLGFSSDNIITFLMPNYGTGVDFALNFSAGF